MEQKIYDADGYKDLLVHNLRVYRERYGFGQKDVCEYLHIGLKSYSKYETGSSQGIPLDVLMNLCNLYHIHLDDLLMEDAAEIPSSMQISVFTQEQQEALQTACQKVLQPGEKLVYLDGDQIQIQHRHAGEIGLHVDKLRRVVQLAEAGYAASMAEGLRAELDSEESRCITAEEARIGRKIADAMGVSYTKYLDQYSLILAPFLRHYKLQSLEDVPAKPSSSYERSKRILRFHTLNELLFIEYFTNQNPFRFIDKELDEIHQKLEADADFLPDMYYHKMNILIYGDYENPIGMETAALKNLQEQNRKIGCFQKDRYSKELPYVDELYLKFIGIHGDVLDVFMEMTASKRKRILQDIFCSCFGDTEKVQHQLKAYYDSRYVVIRGQRWGRTQR